MPRHRKTRFCRLGLKVRAQPPPPSQPEPEPEPEPQSDAEYSSDNDEDPRLKEEYSEHDLRILEASQRKFCEDRAHRHYEAFARQQAILFFRKEISRLRTEPLGQRRRQGLLTASAMLDRLKREQWLRQ
jgi:hypothetical protein